MMPRRWIHLVRDVISHRIVIGIEKHHFYRLMKILHRIGINRNEKSNDNYDFNNQWRGDKVIGIYDARKGTRGTGTFWDAINEFKESRAASTHLKPAMESAAAIRGVNGTYRKSAIVSNKDMENYMEEYNRFLQSPKLQRKYFKYDK